MNEKILEFFKDKNNKIKVVVIVGLVGVLLIMVSEFLPKKDTDNSDSAQGASKSSVSFTSYKEDTQKQLQKIISEIDGVGKCSVYVTFENTSESVYAYNSTSETDEKGEKKEYDYVILNGKNGDEPMLVKEVEPKVKGVVVVCDGGDNLTVRSSIIDSVTSAFVISSNRIAVNKMATNKER